MGMHYIGIVLLGLALLPHSAAASDEAVTEPSVSATATAPSAPARPAEPTQSRVATSVKRADFAREKASRDVHHIADWVVDSGDNKSLPFVIIDKKDARVFVFDAGGRIQGAAPALLGLARGDHTVPGIGDREFSNMPPDTRTTPAGRFVAALGMSTRGVDILWIDYEAAVSLHRVINTNRKERRLERLKSPTPLDNRISYGCVNVPVRFYEKVVRPAFTGTNGIVYVLPETSPVRVAFGSYDVDERGRHRNADQAAQIATIAEPSTPSQ